MSEFKIESGIPIPFSGRARKYPFEKLAVGDSFFVGTAMLGSLTGSCAYASKKLSITLCRRTVTENGVKGIRIWRTA